MNSRHLLLAIAVAIIISTIIIIENPFYAAKKDLNIDDLPSGRKIGTNVGDVAPQFTLSAIDGRTISLTDFRGKVVFINFWATWCAFCLAEMPDIQQVHEEFGDSLVILGINRAESIEQQKRFLNSLDREITYNLLLDPTDSAASLYGVRAMPTSYIINPEGVITDRFLGQISITEMRQAILDAGVTRREGTPRGGGEEVEEVMVTNGVKHIVPLDQVISGGPSKDGIPSIDKPQFISASEAEAFLKEDDLVLGIELNGDAKAYPRRILVWHEIVNDVVGGVPVVVTYCPLCYTGAAFERVLDGEVIEFGVSGKLYNSDLVMYDRKTDSYWSQIMGRAIVGELAGQSLKRLPLDTLEWKNWKKLHPETKVLSTNTGFNRNYNVDPYSGYYGNDFVMFPLENLDQRLHPKTVVYGVAIEGEAKAYPADEVKKMGGVVNDIVGGTPIVVLHHPEANTVKIYARTVLGEILELEAANGVLVDKSSGSRWSYDGEGLSEQYAGVQLTEVISPPNFWFAWAAFHPETDLFLAE